MADYIRYYYRKAYFSQNRSFIIANKNMSSTEWWLINSRTEQWFLCVKVHNFFWSTYEVTKIYEYNKSIGHWLQWMYPKHLLYIESQKLILLPLIMTWTNFVKKLNYLTVVMTAWAWNVFKFVQELVITINCTIG